MHPFQNSKFQALSLLFLSPIQSFHLLTKWLENLEVSVNKILAFTDKARPTNVIFFILREKTADKTYWPESKTNLGQSAIFRPIKD